MATSRTATATTLPARTRMRPIPGPALGHAPVPLQSVLISTLGHVIVAGVVVGSALLWPGQSTKTYIVNLVAAVPAVGVSQGKPATPTKAPVPPPKAEERPTKPEPREPTPPPKAAVEPPSKTKTAPEPPRKAPELPAKATPDLPARAKPIEMPARERPAESAALPDRTLPVREPGLPRASQKELPPMASAVPPKAPARPAPPPPPAPAATPSPRVVSVAPPTPPLGAPTGTAQGSGAVLNTGGDFPFTWYLRQVTQRINQQWDGRARQGQQPLVVFEISPDGRVARLKIEKSSGDEVYDRAALRAIADASPFPPLPVEFKTPPLRVHLGFSYGGDRG